MSNTIATLQAPARQEMRWQPAPPLRAGPEMAALTPFHSNCVWSGSVAAGGMGPGSPEMAATGKGTFTPLMDGAWLAGDFEQDQFLDGKVVITWKAHYVVGWDPRSHAYKVTYVDNNGTRGADARADRRQSFHCRDAAGGGGAVASNLDVGWVGSSALAQ